MPTFISNKNLSVSKLSPSSAASRPITRLSFFQKILPESQVSDQARADFFDHLATLLASGITLVHALEFIKGSVDHPKLRASVIRISDVLRAGEAFSAALYRERDIFDPVAIGMVKAAESSGRLGEISLELAGAYARRAEIRGQMLQAVTYPAVVAGFGFLTVLILLLFVIPKISSVFEMWDTPLPWMTRVLLGLSEFLRGGGFFLLLGLFAAGALILKKRGGFSARKTFVPAAQKIPFIKDIFFLNDFVRLTRTWSMLLRSGVPILETLRASRDVVFAEKMSLALETISQKVIRGARLQEAIQDEAWLPEFAKNFLRIGEETGTLDDSLDKIARFYERQLNAKLKVASTLMEPAFILLVGLSVGVLVISLLMPIFEMSFVVR